MHKPKIFIDGKEGTTGLEIYERLQDRNDIELLLIDEALRKDTDERKRLMNLADLVFLCLPDEAAKEAIKLIDNTHTKVIDASTAHRTHPEWVYGFPELSVENRLKIKKSTRVANPGCHATGFISIVYPLIQLGILSKNYPLNCFSITGYSGGGKSMIKNYKEDKTESMESATLYKLDLNHKHIPEMMSVCDLEIKPLFVPILDDFYRGMSSNIGLHSSELFIPSSAKRIYQALKTYYQEAHFMNVVWMPENQLLPTDFGQKSNHLEITVSGNESQILVSARFDNLGKGASGAAVQNMNLMLGFDEKTGL